MVMRARRCRMAKLTGGSGQLIDSAGTQAAGFLERRTSSKNDEVMLTWLRALMILKITQVVDGARTRSAAGLLERRRCEFECSQKLNQQAALIA